MPNWASVLAHVSSGWERRLVKVGRQGLQEWCAHEGTPVQS